MPLKMFSVYDLKSETYTLPNFAKTVGEAVRQFSDLVNDPSSKIAVHADDFVLYSLGSFCESTASFDLLDVPMKLGIARDFLLS